MNRLRPILIFLLILAYLPVVGLFLLLWLTGYLGGLFTGPEIVQSVPSPDGMHVAYVEGHPSIDPPNQSLLIERADKTRFLKVADLVEDVDSIQTIHWSPNSQIVVFLSRCYLTATRVSDWQTIRIYLGKEWIRSQPSHRSTFCGAQPVRIISEIQFPEPDTVAYREAGSQANEQDWKLIRMNSDDRLLPVLSALQAAPQVLIDPNQTNLMESTEHDFAESW